MMLIHCTLILHGCHLHMADTEAELSLNAGDFVLVFSEMDEDGFYYGELLDGRRGVVPSNFIDKLTGEDLFEFQATVLYGQRDGDESNASYPPEFYDAILNDAMGHTNFQHLLAPEVSIAVPRSCQTL